MENAIATPSEVLGRFAKLVRLLEKADEESGEAVQWDDYQIPIDHIGARQNLKRFLRAGCPPFLGAVSAPALDIAREYDAAREIMGQDFLSPEEVASIRGIRYSDEQLQMFIKTLPTEEILVWCRDNGYLVTPCPLNPMSLLDIRELKREYFYSKTGGWYASEEEKFSRDDKVQGKWLALRKGPVPGSIEEPWDKQVALLSEVEYVPNTAEVAWGITTYKAVRDIYLLKQVYVRTSSVGSCGVRVYLGGFGGGGMRVSGCWDGDPGGRLGVASARKL